MPRRQLETQDKMIEKEITSAIEPACEDKEEIRNKFMTYFLLFFPTIILITIPSTINGGIILSISLKILIAFYQFVTLKTFIDKHYGE